MTWTMINESIKLDADNILYSKQKNEIIQEFNNIKKEVIKIQIIRVIVQKPNLTYFYCLLKHSFNKINIFILASNINGSEFEWI